MPEGRISLGPVIQVGFIVHDCEAYSQRWTTLFELPPARVVEWPLRARLFSVSDTEFVFAVVAHHIGADGVPDPEAAAARMGVDVLQSGDTVKPGGRWYFLDTLAMFGFPLELRRRAPDG